MKPRVSIYVSDASDGGSEAAPSRAGVFPGVSTDGLNEKMDIKFKKKKDGHVAFLCPQLRHLLFMVNLQVGLERKLADPDIPPMWGKPHTPSRPPLTALSLVSCRWSSASTATPVTSWTYSASPPACLGEWASRAPCPHPRRHRASRPGSPGEEGAREGRGSPGSEG